MLRVDALIDIEAAPATALEYLADRRNLPCWLSGVAEVDASRISLFCLDRRLDVRAPLLLERSAGLVSLEAVMPFHLVVKASALPYGTGTRVILRLEAQPGDFFGLPEPVVQLVARRRFAADLVALREQLQRAPSRVPA